MFFATSFAAALSESREHGRLVKWKESQGEVEQRSSSTLRGGFQRTIIGNVESYLGISSSK